MVVVISGPSGVGKDALFERMKRLNRPWHFVVTATTRPKRIGEREGVDYIFLNDSQFQDMLAEDGFLEHAEVYGRWYGVPKDQIEEALLNGKDVFIKTDVQGAMTIRHKIPGSLLIFLAPPDLQELERRLRSRKSETPKDLEVRIKTAALEMQYQSDFDHQVINKNGRLDETVDYIDKIIHEEKGKR